MGVMVNAQSLRKELFLQLGQLMIEICLPTVTRRAFAARYHIAIFTICLAV
jgi:hypothetical protein